MRALWSLTPKREKHFHQVLALLWFIAAWPIMLITGLRTSIALLVFISVYANVAGHWSAAQAAQAEESQEASS